MKYELSLVSFLFLSMLGCVDQEERFDIKEHQIFIVDQSGSSSFTSIQKAVDAAVDGDSIFVKNGKYYESVDTGIKEIILCGESEENTIVISTNGEYNYPPLWCCHGKVMNITFYNKKDSLKDYNGISKWAYALHLDQRWGAEIYNRTVYFTHCTFINDNHAATIGAGVVDGCNIYFDSCTLLSFVEKGAAFQCHTAIGQNGNSNIHFSNCKISAESGTGLLFTNGRLLDSGETSNTITLYANNNIISSFYSTLDKDSLLIFDSNNGSNSIEELNCR